MVASPWAMLLKRCCMLLPLSLQLLPGQVHSYGACHHNKDPEEGLGRDRGSQKMVGGWDGSRRVGG